MIKLVGSFRSINIQRFLRFPQNLQLLYFFSNKIDTSSRHYQLNQQYQEYKKNKWTQQSQTLSQNHNLTQSALEKQKKDLLASLNNYVNSYKFDSIINTQKFIDILSKLSYVAENKSIIESEALKNLLKDIADRCYEFENIQHFCLFLNFVSRNNIDVPEIWENFYGFLKNYHSQLNEDQKLLILDSLNERNEKYLGEFFLQFEDTFLEQLQQERVNLDQLGQVLQIYRKHSKGSDSFNQTIKAYIIQSFPEMKINYQIKFLLHYANNINEKLEDRKEVLEIMQENFYKTMRFLNIRELIQVFFSYVKTGLGSNLLYRLLDERINLVCLDMNLIDIQQILIIGSNEPKVQKTIFAAAEKVLEQRIKDTKPKDLIQIMYLFCESQMGSQEFILKLQNYVYPSLFTATIDDMIDLVWAMQVSPNKDIDQWFEKAGEAITERIKEMNIGQMAQFIWLLSDHYKKLQNPEQSKISQSFKVISIELMKQFEDINKINIKDCAKVLNAYIQNIPIPAYLVDLLYAKILSLSDDVIENEMDTWDLSTILWGFSMIENYDKEKINHVFQLLNQLIVEKLDEMNLYEMLVSIRACIITDHELRQIIKAAIKKIQDNFNEMNTLDSIYLSIFILSRSKFKNEEGQDLLIKNLFEKAERLKQMIPKQPQEDIEKNTEEYLVNLKLNKFKYGEE